MVIDNLGERERAGDCHEGLNRQMSCISRTHRLSEAEVGNDYCGAFLAPAPQKQRATSDDDYIVVTLTTVKAAVFQYSITLSSTYNLSPENSVLKSSREFRKHRTRATTDI